jgi:hypothetical protein
VSRRPDGWPPLLPHLTDPRLVAPRIVALPGGRDRWVGRYEAAVSALDMGERPAAVRPLLAVSYVPSAALLARRTALGAGFDESMRVAEDVDLIWRLAAAGWRVRYEPGAAVAHEHPAGTGEWLRRRAFYGTGAALLAGRHGSAVAPVVISPSTAVGARRRPRCRGSVVVAPTYRRAGPVRRGPAARGPRLWSGALAGSRAGTGSEGTASGASGMTGHRRGLSP